MEENKMNAYQDLDFSNLEKALTNEVISDENQNSGDNLQDSSSDSKEDVVASSSDNPFHIFANVLKEEGFFVDEDLKEFDGTIDALVDRVAKKAEHLAEIKTSNYTPDAKRYIEMLNSGVSSEEAKNMIERSKDIFSITEDTLEIDESLQEEIVKSYLSKTGLSEDEIDEQIEYLRDQDKLTTKAKSFHSKLVEKLKKEEEDLKAQATIENENRKKAQEKSLEDLKEKVFAMKELIPGMELSDKMKEKLFSKITTPAKVENGVPISHVGLKRQKDPVQFEIVLNFLDEMGVFEGDFSKLLNAGKRKSVEELSNSIKTSDFFNKQVAKSTDGDAIKDLIGSLGDLPKIKI